LKESHPGSRTIAGRRSIVFGALRPRFVPTTRAPMALVIVILVLQKRFRYADV
jgi:hypothetical protein